MKGQEYILDKIIEAINYLINIDLQHLDNIIKGIKLLIEAYIDLYKLLEPCAVGVIELQKLMIAIMSTNPIKIAWRLIEHAKEFLHDIQDAVTSLQKGDFRQAGKDIGDIMYRLFLDGFGTSLGATDIIFEFVKGFFQGLNEKGDANKILECLQGLEPVMAEIIKALELISKFNLQDIIEGVQLLIKAVTEFVQSLKPCTDGFEQLKKLIEALTDINLIEIITKIMQNPAPFMKSITECIEAFKRADYHGLGKGLGEIMYKFVLKQ